MYVKKSIAFLFCFILFKNLCAQNIAAKNILFNQFIDSNNHTVLPNKYFLITGAKQSIYTFQQQQQLHIARQLSDSIFIISVTDTSILKKILKFANANNNWKLSDNLFNRNANEVIKYPFALLTTTNNDIAFLKWAAAKNIYCTNTSAKNTFIVNAKNKNEFNKIINCQLVYSISQYHTLPLEELQINDLDVSVNKINVLHSKMPFANGNGLTISIKENKPDTTDIDIAGRYFYNTLAATNTNSHATIMATMAAGAGNSYYLGKGVAWGASITSSNFTNLLPDANLNYLQNNISVQNHSYGVGVENFYGADAAAFDSAALTNDKLLFVFSAGNSGTITPATGNYTGIANVANLTGSFKMAKNIITVGSVDSFINIAAASSKGPAYDGRIKPEMVAYGEDGSSGAAALVSGTAIILQHIFKTIHNDSLPSSYLTKAILLNSCDDVGAAGIDFASGFGNLNAYKAAENMATQKYFTGAVANNAMQTFSINIPANISKAKIMLVWNDLPASTNAFTSIKNDLDITVQSSSTLQTWQPWVLNSSPNKDSLAALPVRKRDSLNTIEQITIDNPASGNYKIFVAGFLVSSNNQLFAIAYQFDTANIFNWVFPTKEDNIFSATSNLIRWNASFTNAVSNIEYSIDKGNTWKLVVANQPLVPNYFRWIAPDTNASAILRITIGSQIFTSDTFTISTKPNLKVGFNCTDSVLLFWNKLKGITNYQLYGLGNIFLKPLNIIADTQFVFTKTALPFSNFAVASLLNSMPGVKSYTTNYASQGVDCYIANLLATLTTTNTIQLQLSIGTTYQIKKISFEKLIGNVFSGIYQTNTINGLGYSFTDVRLLQGINNYRAVIYLLNGQIIYSDVVSVIYFAGNNFLVYPNPVLQNNILNIQVANLNNQIITITDFLGRKVLQKTLNSTVYSLHAVFAKGVYMLTITDAQTHTQSFSKILVQ